jgi:threonine dehydratase
VLSREDLSRVQSLVYQHMRPTACYAWPLLCQALGCEVWVKHENHTPTGAFKVRGGLVYLDELSRDPAKPDIVTATRGNHGQSIPFAARQFGLNVHVYVPRGNSTEKNAAMQAWGAQLHVHGEDFDEAREAAEAAARESGAHGVPSFHEHLVRGVATYGAELFDDVESLDAVYVPIGMGSGAASLVWVRDLLGLTTEIVGVVSENADAMARSIEEGRLLNTNSAHTFADGVATRVPHVDAFDILKSGLARVVRVSDDEIAEAMRLLYRTTHNVAEGAGAAATAALTQERSRQQNKRVAVVLTGGNIDLEMFSQVLAGNTPQV